MYALRPQPGRGGDVFPPLRMPCGCDEPKSAGPTPEGESSLDAFLAEMASRDAEDFPLTKRLMETAVWEAEDGNGATDPDVL